MSLSSLAVEIELQAAAALRAVRPDARFDAVRPSLLRDVSENLGPGVDHESVRFDFAGSTGVDTGLPVISADEALRSPCSGAALAVNTFGPFRSEPALFDVPGFPALDVLRFAKRLRMASGGVPVRVDALGRGPSGVLTVTCAFVETLRRRAPGGIAGLSVESVSSVASPEWSRLYRSMCERPRRFRLLPAAALVAQHLAVRFAFADDPEPQTMLYVFWEPANWQAVPVFSRHRREILDFALGVAGSGSPFVAMSCFELWDAIEKGPAWAGRDRWLEYLRARYRF